MLAFRTAGIAAKTDDARVAPAVREVCAVLRSHGCAVLLEAESCPGPVDGTTTLPFAELVERVDLMIVIGGDGTLLRTGRKLAGRDIPLLGVHHGRLGFLVDVRPERMHDGLGAVLSGQFVVEQRLTLEATIEGDDSPQGAFCAINDVVVRAASGIRMIEFETWLGDEFISAHRADGFIIATPTGSTAYALSSGGPVMHPGLQAIAMVPVCPHTLSDRPLVVGAGPTVRVRIAGKPADGAMMTCDGQVERPLRAGQTVAVRASDWRLRLLHPPTYRYFDVLRDKLHWGRSQH